LSKALVAEADARNQAIRDACLFGRCPRPVEGRRPDRKGLEMNEGLAEYTGLKVVGPSDSQARSDLASV